MKQKGVVLAVLLVSLIVFSSGCISKIGGVADELLDGECNELEDELNQKEGIECECYPTDFVPDKLKNKTDVEGKCYCNCNSVKNNNTTKVSVVETGEGETIVSRLD
ncbi:MAG: hypothetical protein ACLFS3_01140 [Candidatus Aenigmatarchaeota archaeon]